ncbi:MAG: purine nucleoside phosphorylase I inosine and guanosine-specific [Ignavibacteria bacterium]|nr:MAG: purine nucleoside phosphorylase I inosine and guanosine-specific [Ignavibacteria bacterium]KAF0160326.1 MAG: purine nucleoside phosphorylase I inosine and guanosine-specific [Ignavibacteria bacterium]
MINMNAKYRDTYEAVAKQIPFEPEICVVLGSGLGDFAEKVETIRSIPTSSLPNYPVSTVQGHDGYLHFANYANKKLLIVQGRIHLYEGYRISQCMVPVYVSSKLNCKKILLTNAAGGVNQHFTPGDLMLNSSFNGINIKKELTDLIGITSLEKKNTFLDFPSHAFINIVKNAALQEKISLKEGVYWFNKGPSYETPAEIRMTSYFGGDAVGMSTAHEAVYAAYLGMEVAAISCITNMAAGLSSQKLSHTEVMETAEMVKKDFERLVKKIIELS